MNLKNPAYRVLATDSSNLMLKHDGEVGQGNDVEAAYAIWQAGGMRSKMADLSLADGDYGRAIADNLSSSACYIVAADAERAALSLRKAQELEKQGKVPPERSDLPGVIREREAELRQLEERQERFLESVQRRGRRWNEPNRRTLNYLRSRSPDFPGWAVLHGMIAFQAQQLGDLELAAEHREWVKRFVAAPWIEAYFTIQELNEQGHHDEAIKRGERFIAEHPDAAGMVAPVLSQAIYARFPGEEGPRRATELLRRYVGPENGATASPSVLAHLAFFAWKLGDAEAFQRYKAELRAAEAAQNGSRLVAAPDLYSALIGSLPELNGGGDAAERREAVQRVEQRIFAGGWPDVIAPHEPAFPVSA